MEILLGIVILVFSAILHEVMHGFVADKLGDPTARLMGRLTLNPIPHIDPLTSVIVPALLIVSGSPIIFGAAKPVPINPSHFKDGKKDMALTALAGPFTNLALVILATILLRIFFSDIKVMNAVFAVISHAISIHSLQSLILFILADIIYVNLILTIINLIPIPPLDGSRFVSYLLPNHLATVYNSFERIGIIILFVLLLTPLGAFSLGNLISQLLLLALRLLSG